MSGLSADPTLFRWTGGPDQTEDPTWAVNAIQAGGLEFTNDGTPDVRLKVTDTGQTAKPGDCLTHRDGTIRVIPAGVAPNACRHCGDDKYHHGNQWHRAVGFHKWIEPTDEQRKDRMKARALGGEK
ncbi:hypothetical protein [Nocardiopsis sp. NRRL B-16309]|uniref:hypothetical protein n=1 Tax=Nocardiopsis sp. NRRL B-16309 TaxID=1519494 RepID=UPI0006AE212F|nr:hypothetical protein [Nocardiopsis sp. NRRL B-16309]KOX10121.1 hypothetical protein ADL05_25915 [Nocardiopsis sp. NRRL B-16309]